MTKLRGST